MGRAGIEPATQTRRFYRPLPTPIGEPTQKVVQTGLEPANYTLERRAARPLRFCTINAKDLDLNPDQRFWRPLCCRYTIPAFGSSGESRTRIYQVMSLGLCRKSLHCNVWSPGRESNSHSRFCRPTPYH